MKEAAVFYHISAGQKPTPEQLAEIRAAAKRPAVYDEDNPEIDPEKTPELYEAAMNAVAERNRRISAQVKSPA